MNGNGIQPTVELATTNGNGFAYPYPVMYGNGYGNGGFGYGDGSWIWIILLFALFGGNWGNNGNGFFGGGFDNGYAWLSNGQKDIMTNTNNGFDTLHLSNNIEGIQSQISGLSNQLCNCCGDITSAISTSAYNAEIAAANRQMADMNQNFALQSQLANCCCENRLATANLNATILSENCADRAALADSTQRIITNATDNTRALLDKLCQLELDQKNEKIVDLQREILMKDLQASQVAQTAELRANQATTANLLVSELRSCPIPSQPVYGNSPIFTCQPNYGGCGCNGNFTTSQFI